MTGIVETTGPYARLKVVIDNVTVAHFARTVKGRALAELCLKNPPAYSGVERDMPTLTGRSARMEFCTKQ